MGSLAKGYTNPKNAKTPRKVGERYTYFISIQKLFHIRHRILHLFYTHNRIDSV